MERKCLIVIDEQSQKDRLQRVSESLRKDGIELSYKEINPKSFQKRLADGDAQFDENRFKAELQSISFINNLDVFATDYNLIGNILEGIDVIRLFTEIKPRFNKKVIIYSAQIENVLDDIISKDFSFKEKINRLKLLSQYNVEYLTSEGAFENNFKKLIETEPIFTIDNLLANKLYAIGNNPMVSLIPPYERMGLNELADLFSVASTDSQKIKNEIADHLLANIINVEGYE